MKLKKYIIWMFIPLFFLIWFFVYYNSEFFNSTKSCTENQISVDQQENNQESRNQLIQQLQDLITKAATLRKQTCKQEHSFKELKKTIYSTPEERKELFAELGIAYLNEIIFDYTPILEVDPKKSEKYLTDIQGNDALSQLYSADIAMKTLLPMSIRWLGDKIGHGI
ncbi:MAG: hypothetical protein JO129_04390, partial [Candidatus Dependentiae bacterium]|nr:hypothetical protein [Candidatus Dependentiae bacterium]